MAIHFRGYICSKILGNWYYPPRKQELGVEQVLGVPISQGSLAQMQRYFKVCFGPIYQQWLTYVPQPGVRCVDETTYCIDGIKYWLWVATSAQVCVLLLAPTGSSAELKQLSGENFEGILIPIHYEVALNIASRI